MKKFARLEFGSKRGGKYSDLESAWAKTTDNPKIKLSFVELLKVLSPYFWPAKGSDGAVINRIRSTSTWFMVICSKACSLSAPLMLSQSTNYLISGQFYKAMLYIIIFTSLKFGSSLFKELQSAIYIKVKQQATIQLQETTFAHLHSLSLNWHLSKKTGSIMRSMDRGVDAANQLISSLFLYLIPAIMECFAVMILFFVQFKQWSLGLVIFLGVTLFAIDTVIFTEIRKQFREQTNKHDNDFHDRATDSIVNYETVKYFTGESYEIDRFTKSVFQYQKSNSSTQLYLSLLNISQQVILNATLLACMILSGRAVIRGEMTLGGWVAVQSWVTTIFAPLNFLGSIYSSIFQAIIDIRNLLELLAQSPEIIDEPNAVPIPIQKNNSSQRDSLSFVNPFILNPILPTRGLSVQFKNISFHYPEQPPDKGLKDINFLVPPGTTTAIVGHTGAGKTTISRLLFRFYDPNDGCVLIDGYDIKKYQQKSVRESIGIVPQDTVLFNDSILHNIKYGNLSATFQEVVAAAEAAHIRQFIESLPDKWETVVGERGLKLSGGEKQRVAIARCLLKNPPVVLLDEATSALDTLTENSIQEALAALGQHRTVLIIAHRLSTIRHANQIIVMDGGRIIERGTHDELISSNSNEGGMYARMWAMQTAYSNVGSSANLEQLQHHPLSGEHSSLDTISTDPVHLLQHNGRHFSSQNLSDDVGISMTIIKTAS